MLVLLKEGVLQLPVGVAPTASLSQEGAIPSPDNQALYFKAFVQWAQ